MKPFPLMVALLIGLSVTALGAAGDTPVGNVKDRAGYIPNRKQAPVAGKAIGVLLADGQPILDTEGRSGPADQLVFSADGNSYRWVYVPTQDKPLITNLQVPAGAKGELKQVYPALNMANLRSVAPWNITMPYTLVEVEVNGGKGSPKYDSFVATSFRIVEGTKDYPLKAAEVIKDVKDRYAAYLVKKRSAIEQTMKETAEKALNGKPPTGPRERSELMYVTWLAESSTLRVHFKTTISDGAYMVIGGGDDDLPRPLPKGIPLPKGTLRVAPPKKFGVKVGTTFGLEIGQAYNINKDGKVIGMEELPIETFTQQLNQRPGIRPGLPPRPLPPGPIN